MKEREFFYTVQQEFAGKRAEQVAQPSQAVNFVYRPSKPSRKLPALKSDTPTHWGHWAADCRVPKKQKEEVPHNVVNMMVDNSDPKSFVSMIGSSRHGASSEWWLDSGATCHVTNDISLLTEIRSVHDRVENCDGGETTVTHAATTNFILFSDFTIWKWLFEKIRLKEYFVCAWIDNYLHLGNSTTNWVEGSYSRCFQCCI